MGEALASLGIAANIAQFVGLSMEMISIGKEVYNSLRGTREEHEDLEIMIKNMENLHDNVRGALEKVETGIDGPDSLSQTQMATAKPILELAQQCRPVSNELLHTLDDLKVASDSRFRALQTFKKTFKLMGKKNEIEALVKRILQLHSLLKSRLSFLLEIKHHSEIVQLIQTLDRRQDRLAAHSDKTLENLRTEILQSFSLGHDRIVTRINSLLELADMMNRQQSLLESLLYNSIKEREETIKDAHASTLRWIFDPSATKFIHWLENENGIFWIKGKAGSGKSTLMKYVCNETDTMNALRLWAKTDRLVTASYFFWNAGLPMQKSQKGLLQSLLYQVLAASPSFVSEPYFDRRSSVPWGRKELFQTLQQIAHDERLSTKFCFFIDALDEYEGEDEDIVCLLLDLSSSPNIKICISSRPWNTFLDAFDQKEWKLALEDLTRNDMKGYVHGMLIEDQKFETLAQNDDRYGQLEQQIVERAQGVWLWVYLVVRDLLRDIKGAEQFEHLQKRIDSFPAELEEYFENILGRIDKIYRQETAEIFLVTVEAVRPLPVLALKYLAVERDERLSPTSPNYALDMDICPIEDESASQIFTEWRYLLNSRCRDLLEVNIRTSEPTILKYRVDFLHRTVRDFLRDNYQRELLRRADQEFSASKSLCMCMLALFKGLDVSPKNFRDRLDQILGLVDEMIYYCREIELKNNISETRLLEELDRVASHYAQTTRNHWTNARDPPEPTVTFQEYGQCTFLALAVQSRLLSYVSEKLKMNPGALHVKQGRPLLDYALRPKRVTPADLPYQLLYEDTNIDVRMVRFLLSQGADPNQTMRIYAGQSPWTLFLILCYNDMRNVSHHTKQAWFETVEMLIEHGADSKVRCMDPANPDLRKVGKSAIYKQDVVLEYFTVAEILHEIFSAEQASQLELQMSRVAEWRKNQTPLFWRLLGW